MEMETSSAQHHHQEMMGSQTLESILVSTKPQQEKKPRPADQEAIQCPRCDSPNTKFCYYNNYSLSQPRYFCKSCRRYWTKGGTLRNVPVGGGCRKNKRSSSSSTSNSTSPSSRRNQDHPMPSPIPCLTHLSYDHDHHSDLSLAIARLQKQTNLQLGYDNLDFSILGDPNMAQSEGLGNSGVNTPTGYFEPPSGFHNMYYGMENGGMGINGISQEMGLGFEELGSTAVTNVKQEMCAGNGREDESGRVLWGFPWHGAGGDHGSHIGETDPNRLSWNGIGSANWHGLLNSPLM